MSADGVTWTTVFDSAVSGEYVETLAGKTHTFTQRSVRYVRDYLNGSTANSGNHWTEIEVWGTATTAYVGDYFEWNGSVETMTRYYSAGGTRVAVRNSNGNGTDGLVYLLGDHLGSTSLTADPLDGDKLSELRYKAWGETRHSLTNAPTDRRFTGQAEEASIGLYYYGARFYDPLLARWTSPDSIIPQTQGTLAWDRYAYVNNSPLNYTDPTGHIANWVIGGLVGGIVGGGLYLANEIIRQDGFNVSNASDWRDLGTSVLQGSVAGLLVATPGGQAAGLGMTSSLIGDHASNLLTGTDYNAVTTTIGALAGAATGSINKGVISLGQKAINSGILNGGANTLEQSLLGQDTDVGDFFSNFVWSAGSTYFSGDYSRSLQNPTLNPIAVPTTKFQAELTSAVFTPSLRSWVKDEFIPFIHSAE